MLLNTQHQYLKEVVDAMMQELKTQQERIRQPQFVDPELIPDIFSGVKIIGLDIETSGLDRRPLTINGVRKGQAKSETNDQLHLGKAKPRLVAFAGYKNNTPIVHLVETYDGIIPTVIKQWMNNYSRTFITINGTRFDIPILYRHGVRIQSHIDLRTNERVLAAGYDLNIRGKYGLEKILERRVPGAEKLEANHNWWNRPFLPDEAFTYASNDVQYLIHILAEQYQDAIAQGMTEAINTEKKLSVPVARMLSRGVTFDLDKLDKKIAQKEIEEQSNADILRALNVEDGIDYGEVNIRQKATLDRIFRTLKIRSPRNSNRTGNPSYDATALGMAYVQYPKYEKVFRAIRSVRRFKWLKTYRDSLKRHAVPTEDSGLYTIFSQLDSTGAETYRFTGMNPNPQNISRDIRDVIVAKPYHKLVFADWRQIEAVIMAMYMNADSMIQACMSGDMHNYSVSLMWTPKELRRLMAEHERGERNNTPRQDAKATTYGLGYGGTAFTVTNSAFQRFEYIPMARSEDLVKRMFEVYPEWGAYIRNTYNSGFASKMSERMRIPLGGGYYRELNPRKIKSQFGDFFQFPPTQRLNTPIQAAAARLMKNAIIYLRETHADDYLIMTIHDELLSEVPEEKAEWYAGVLTEAMEAISEITFPQFVDKFPLKDLIRADVKIGDTWEKE